MKALGDYIHGKNLSFATYTAESSETCGGYPASANHEVLDAQTFAEWGVDYLCVGAFPFLLRLFLLSHPAPFYTPHPPLFFYCSKVDGCGA